MSASASGQQAESSTSKGPAQARCIYTAAAVNRSSQVAEWADFGETAPGGSHATHGEHERDIELIYATNKSIAIAPGVVTRHPAPTALLTTQHGRITVVKLAYNRHGKGKGRIVAASDDGWLHVYKRNGKRRTWTQAAAWHVKDAGNQQDSSSSAMPRKRPGIPQVKKAVNSNAVPVRALGVCRQRGQQEVASGDQSTIIASASSDGEMQIWKLDDGDDFQVKLLQRIELGRTRAETKTEILPLDIAMTALPGSDDGVLLAVAGTDNKISLYISESGQDFRKLFAISGHTDWVRSLDICQVPASSEQTVPGLMLASGAQDNHIRLWRFEATEEKASAPTGELAGDAALDDFDKLAAQIEDSDASETIATKSQTFRCGSLRWSVSLDALLTGHEHWVTGVRWCPPPRTGNAERAAAILSSSADNSIILWTPSSGVSHGMSNLSFAPFSAAASAQTSFEENVWVPLQRFGELGNVGSAANGMYGAAWHPQSGESQPSQQAVIGHGYGGAVHVWARQSTSEGRAQTWHAQPGRGGHFAAANALQWEPKGAYLISGGSDKTTRLHGALRDEHGESWHEMARPQTHGYEIFGLGWLSRLAFASAGDEKTIRVFEAPTGYVQSAQSLGLTQPSRRSNLLISSVKRIEDLCNPTRFAAPIKEATRTSLEHGRLDICVVSPLFENIDRQSAPQVTFAQAEQFLKWCYAMAWGVAVEKKALLFDVDVILGSKETLERLVQETAYTKVFGVDNDDATASISCSSLLQASKPDDKGLPVEATRASLEQREAIAMGGTFDHLHVGHKILLSMACLLATRRIVVGVTDDSMLTKKKQAQLLEPIEKRIARVTRFMERFCDLLGRPLEYDVIKLQDVAGPAGTDSDLSALLFTDETVGGADFIDGVREKNGLQKLERFSIGVIGSSGETDVKGKDASELAAAKVGSTAIREWLSQQHEADTSLEDIPTLTGEARAIGASVPPLGLSNRAIYGNANEPRDGPSESGQPVGKAIRSIATHLQRPPVEEELHNHSIWTEVTKLYGHSLELLALDVDRHHGLIASSCKANHAELAGVRLHDTRRGWKEVQVLMGHALGVTRMRFSPDGSKLVTVSRDRSWRLFTRKSDVSEEGKEPFEQVCADEEAHGRIIYDVAWCGPLQFATASRDGTIKTWSLTSDGRSVEFSTTISLRTPVTALAVDTSRQWLAAGTEAGRIHILVSRTNESGGHDWQQSLVLDGAHADAISELAWQPVAASGTEGTTSIGSAAKDGAVRIFDISM